mmetsp:Transcript_129786/g.276998  ORF Transcript_129786/g.276998 Transcript_129786/m.276998 type:complete len:201 (+) Transcript_129786:871-1473(+)
MVGADTCGELPGGAPPRRVVCRSGCGTSAETTAAGASAPPMLPRFPRAGVGMEAKTSAGPALPAFAVPGTTVARRDCSCGDPPGPVMSFSGPGASGAVAVAPPVRKRSSLAAGGEALREPTRRSHFSMTAELPPLVAARRSSVDQRDLIASANSLTSASPWSMRRKGSCKASVQCLGALSANKDKNNEASAAARGGRPGP